MECFIVQAPGTVFTTLHVLTTLHYLQIDAISLSVALHLGGNACQGQTLQLFWLIHELQISWNVVKTVPEPFAATWRPKLAAGLSLIENWRQKKAEKTVEGEKKPGETFVLSGCIKNISEAFAIKLFTDANNSMPYIRKEFSSGINQIYCWRSFCNTHIHYNQCLWREKFITQLCLQIWSGGTPVLLASPQVTSFWPS